jgi:hypothetical protein
MDIQKLIEALAHAVTIIESYEMDIRNSESVIGVDLAAKGFCQGEAYKAALATIRRKAEGVTTAPASP